MMEVAAQDLVLPEWGWHYPDIEADQKLMLSLQAYGQLSPVITYTEDGVRMVVLDGRRRVHCLQAQHKDVFVRHLGQMSREQAVQVALSLELRSDINFASLARHVSSLASQGINVQALGSTTPFTAERMGYFVRLCDFDWSTYEESVHASLFGDEDEEQPITAEALAQMVMDAEAEPAYVPPAKVRKTAPQPHQAAIPTINRLAHVLAFEHTPAPALAPAAPAPAPRVELGKPGAVVLPTYLRAPDRDNPALRWVPSEPPPLDRWTALSFDTETNGVKWYAGDRPIGISIHADGVRQYLPWGHLGGGNLQEEQVKRWAERELRGKHLTGANIRFDVHMMREWGIDLEAQGCTFSDVQHQAALLDEYRHKFGLADMMEEFLPELRKAGGGGEINKERMADYHAGEVAEYAELDAEGVTELVRVFAPRLSAEDLERVRDLENAVIPVVCEMEKNAALLHRPMLHEWYQRSRAMMDEIGWELARDLGFPMNPDKNEDWQRLFEKLGIPVTHFTELGAPSFTDEVLAAIDHHHVQRARRYGKLTSLRSKFLEPYYDVVGPDCKLRFALHQLRGDEYGTIRGRFSMSGGGKNEPRFGANLQQVFSVDRQREAFGIHPDDSTHDEEIFLVRRLFISHEDGCVLTGDAQSIEYRLAAHFAVSKPLLEAYQADWAKLRDPRLRDGKWVDFHRVVQDMITPHKSVTRKTTKNLNFLKIYGGGRDKAAQTLGLSRPETDQIIDLYDSMFPEFKKLLNRASTTARERGWVRTLAGRRARFPNKEFTHAALNYIIQGSAADVMKQKLVELHAERAQTGFVMRFTVHDEVDGDAMLPETEERVTEILNRQSFETHVPLVWQVKLGNDWSKC
jgi:DNA polymerase I-like protein with 3'-5' exonuclease and polymerase domains